MFYIVHVLLGGIIGSNLNSIILIISLGILSHFILDSIPHWGLGFDLESFNEYFEVSFMKKTLCVGAIDAIVAISLIFLLYNNFHTSNVVIGCIAALFPDIISAGYFTKLKNKKTYRKIMTFHGKIQKESGFFYGILTQLILVIIFIKILF